MTESRVPQAEGATFIALGTNLPFQNLSGPALLVCALERIEAAGVKVLKRSSFWRSAPWPAELADQPPFVNAAAEVDPGDLDAPGLFAVLTGVEAQFGRERRTRWAPRTLDLDIVDFKGKAQQAGDLVLPHPRARERAFVLAPLAEIAPAWRHPVTGESAAQSLARLGTTQEIEQLR
jgi:2-amino-4-hydroxy-6-hydroxymethyldihydropteridine diphosphokinase